MGIKEKSIKAYKETVEEGNKKFAERIKELKEAAQEYVKKHINEDIDTESMSWFSPHVTFTIEEYQFVYRAITKTLHMVGVCSDCGMDVLSVALYSPADIGFILSNTFLPDKEHVCKKTFII